MVYTLVSEDIDLGRHVRDVAYWKRPYGALISGTSDERVASSHSRSPNDRKGGAHLLLTTGDKARWSPEGKSPEEIAKHVDEAVTRARELDPGSTEYEHAWSEIAAHTEALAEHAKLEGERARVRAKGRRTGDPTKPVKVVSESARVARERSTEFFSINALASVGAHAAAAAGGLISAEQAHNYAEQFHHIAESAGGEITLAVIVTFLLSGLATLIKRALDNRRDRKIDKARAVDPAYTMLPLPKPAPGERQFPDRVSPGTVPLHLKGS